MKRNRVAKSAFKFFNYKVTSKYVGCAFGIVNKKGFLWCEAAIIHFKNQIESLKAKYSKQTGKKLILKACGKDKL